MIAGIEDDVFDRLTQLQDRTDNHPSSPPGPDPGRRTFARLRDRGAHRAFVGRGSLSVAPSSEAPSGGRRVVL